VSLERRFCALVKYDGTEFFGYQIQPKVRTVQGELEKALQRITQTKIRTNAAGRTDAGVHATGQVVAFEGVWRHEVIDLQRALNATLAYDIVIANLKTINKDFHPRFSAVNRSYRYTIINQDWPAVLERRYAHHIREPLDVAAMVRASQVLLGAHDFASFGKPPQGQVTVREVMKADWAAVEQRVTFQITANAFLYRMVRKIVGTLLKVGLGQLNEDDILEILAARDLTKSASPAPAQGLCLTHVAYPFSLWDES